MIMRGWKGGPRSSGLLGGPILEGGPQTSIYHENISHKRNKKSTKNMKAKQKKKTFDI